MSIRPSAGLAVALAFAGLAGVLAVRGRAPLVVAEATAATPAGAAPQDFTLPRGDARWGWLRVEPAERGSDRLVAVLPAQVSLDEDRSVRIVSPVVGRVARVEARPGERVTAGQALARITSGEVGQAQSDQARAEAVARQSAATLVRTRELYEHHVVALKDLQQAEADDAQARAEADRSREQARLLGAGREVDQTLVLRSPVAGEVLERNLNPGGTVRPDDAAPLFVVSDLRHVWITANVYPRDLSRVRAGDRVRFTTDALPGRAFEARVTWVGDALDPATRTAPLRAELDNPDGALRAQMPGEVSVLAAGEGRGAVVPARALVTHGADTQVVVEVAPGRFRRRTVTVGQDDGTTASILAGLAPGERVVTQGSLLLSGEMDRERP